MIGLFPHIVDWRGASVSTDDVHNSSKGFILSGESRHVKVAGYQSEIFQPLSKNNCSIQEIELNASIAFFSIVYGLVYLCRCF